MALTQISTQGIKDGTITNADLNTSAAIARTKLANVDLVDDTSPQLGGDLDTNSFEILLDDAHAVKFGDSQDAEIKHTGSNFVIRNTEGNIRIEPKNGELGIQMTPDAGVSLYYDNSKKFETTSTGLLIDGNIKAGDNDHLYLGDNQDINIYHDGSDSYFYSGATTLFFRNASNEKFASFISDGAVELYHDNSKKFETTSYGVSLTGTLCASGNIKTCTDTGIIAAGVSDDLKVFHNGTDSKITNTTGNLIITQSDGIIRLDPKTNENGILIRPDTGVELYYGNVKHFETNSGGVKVNDSKYMAFGNHNDLQISHDGSNSLINVTGTGTLRIQEDGSNQWEFNGANFKGNDQRKVILGDSSDLQLYHHGHSTIQNTNSVAALLISSFETHIVNAALTENIARFKQNGACELFFDNSKQFETTSTGTTTFGTAHSTSDIALKTNIKPITNTLEKIQQITGYKYKFIKSNENSIGVVAQEVEKVFPELVDGTEGNKTLQYNGLIGVLIEAVKELSDEVAALKAA